MGENRKWHIWQGWKALLTLKKMNQIRYLSSKSLFFIIQKKSIFCKKKKVNKKVICERKEKHIDFLCLPINNLEWENSATV